MAQPTVQIRHLQMEDAGQFLALRREALAESPLAFASSPTDDLVGRPEFVRDQLSHEPDSVIVGAFAPLLVGMAGLYRDRHMKASHRAHLWGMYVTPEYRKQGVASALLRAVLQHADSLPGVDWVHLTVSDAVPNARRLYERAGFEVWGIEPDAFRHEGCTAGEYHMAVRLPVELD